MRLCCICLKEGKVRTKKRRKDPANERKKKETLSISLLSLASSFRETRNTAFSFLEFHTDVLLGNKAMQLSYSVTQFFLLF